MPTTNPVPSYDPTDLLFNAQKLDEVVNSASATYADRLGVTRRTLAGLEAEFPNAQANAAAASASATDAAEAAQIAQDEAAVAISQASAADASRVAAEAARDAAMLSAGVYATTAAGLAATTNGQYFNVPASSANDSLILYLNSSGTAVEVKRYPSKAAIDAIPLTVSALPEDVDAELLLDSGGNIARRTDARGHMYLPEVPVGSVQDALARAEQIIDDVFMAVPGDALVVADTDGRISLRQDGDGRLFIPGMPGSVQEALGYPISRSGERVPTARDTLLPAIKAYVQDLMIEGYDFVPPPAVLVPNGMTVPNGIVSAFTVTEPVGQDLYTPYGFGGTVHPYLLEMRRPFLGYRYLMSDTPHNNGSDKDENPILYGSNDLKKFDLISGITQPFDMPAPFDNGFMPDASLAYDPRTGVLYLLYSYVDGVRFRATRNGREWTPPVTAFSMGDTKNLSPTFLFNPTENLWHMFATDGWRIFHYTNPVLGAGWTQAGIFDTRLLATNSFECWHLEVKFMGGKYVALANQKDNGANLYLGISSDGNNWTFGPPLISPAPVACYKGSFLPEFSGNNLRLHLAWNLYNFPLTVVMKFFCAPTNWVDLTTL